MNQIGRCIENKLNRRESAKNIPNLILPIKSGPRQTHRHTCSNRQEGDTIKFSDQGNRTSNRKDYIHTLGDFDQAYTNSNDFYADTTKTDRYIRTTNNVRLESDRRRRQLSYDNYQTRKYVSSPKRVSVFETEGTSNKPSLGDYDIQRTVDDRDFFSNPAFVRDMMYKARFLEEENKSLRTELEDRDTTIKLLKLNLSNQKPDLTNSWHPYDPNTTNKQIVDLQNKIQVLKDDKLGLLQKVRQMEQSLKEEEYKLKLKLEENYRKYMEEYEKKLLYDLMTNGETFKQNYLKDHIIRLNKDLEGLNKVKNEVNVNPVPCPVVQNDTQLKARVNELEAENRYLQERYYQFKASVTNRKNIDALEACSNRVVSLETQLRDLKKKYNELLLGTHHIM